MSSLKPFIDQFLGILTFFASRTETTIDDQAVRFLAAVSASPALLEWIESLYEQNTPSGALSMVDAPEPVRAELAAAGFDWTQLIQYLPVVLELLKQFRNRRQG